MTVTRKPYVLPLCLLVLTTAVGFSQTPESDRILDQTGEGVIVLVIYGQDKAEIAKGSALVLADDIVATSYHFISRAYDAAGLTAKGKKLKVEGIVAVDKERDLALVKIKGKVQPLTLGNSDAIEDGARVFAVGSNESGQISVSEGTLLRSVEVSPQIKVMEITLTAPDPFTGGPIFNLSGQVVGMMQILDRGIKVGIPVNQWKDTSRTGRVEELKSRTPEDYFAGFEGASFVGRVAAALNEQMAARIHLENVVKLNPNYIEAHTLLADVYVKQRDYATAADSYRKVTGLDATRADAFYGLGIVLARMAKHGEAIPALEKAVSLNFDKKEVFLELGNAYEAVQDFAKAAGSYERYLGLKPEISWGAYLQLALCRISLEQYDAAVAALLEAKKEQPRDIKINVTLAEAYQKGNQPGKAEETLNHLAEINPGEAKYYYGQAIRMYDAAGNYAAAINPAKKIVALNPQDEMSVYNLGLMYFKQERFDEAVDAFKQCLAVNPAYAYAWFQIGAAYYNQKKYREAVEPYKKYIELSPDDQFGWLSLGVTYMNFKDFESALEPMRKAVEIKPDNANAQYNLAIVYLNLKDNLSARDVYNKLQTLDPSLAEKLKKYLR